MESRGRTRISQNYIPFLRVENHYIPITFALFDALTAIDNGLLAASLPTEVYSPLDRATAMVSGRIVRHEEILSDDPIISLGNSGHVIEIINKKFSFSKRNLTTTIEKFRMEPFKQKTVFMLIVFLKYLLRQNMQMVKSSWHHFIEKLVFKV